MLIENDIKTASWTHYAYEKIAEGIDKINLTVDDYRKLNRYDWVVTEKIHGANFSIITDGTYVRYAKRKEFLMANEEFFRHNMLKDKLNRTIYDLYKLINSTLNKNSIDIRIVVYGEIFGGFYPHSGVQPVNGVEPVQTGVYYSPNIEFCGFDIAIIDTKKNFKNYLDYDTSIKLFKEIDMLYAEPLYTGNFKKASEYPLGFVSTIPKRLGLPELGIDNVAEGIVVKPIKSVVFETSKGLVRPIIKKKIEKFSEDEKYNKSQNWYGSKDNKYFNYNSVEGIYSNLSCLVNINRLNSAISKIGKSENEHGQLRIMIADEIYNDVMESFVSSYNMSLEAFAALNDYDREEIIKQLKNQIFIMIDKNM